MSFTSEGSLRRPPQRGAAGVAIGGFLLPILVFRSLLDPRQILVAGDLAFFHLPLRTLFRRAVWEGIPWWNGAIHGGQPILSNPNYAAFYPPSWLVLALPPATAIHLLLLLHVGWAYAGAWRLARHLGCRPATALLAALGFTLGGAFVSSASLLTMFCGLAWTPWILLWACRVLEAGAGHWRRDAVLVALGLAAQFLAGEPVNCILSGVALAALAVDGWASRREPGRRLALAVLLALLLAGIQLLPTLRRVADSGRGGGLDLSTVTHRSMPPVRLLELAVPHPLGDPMRLDEELFYGQRVFDEGFPYLVSIYPGLLVLVLALGGLGQPRLPRRWAWLAMLAAGIFLALGRFNPLYLALLPHLPILDQTRYPEKMLLVGTAALPVLAALCLEVRLRARRAAARGLDLASFLCGLLVLLLGALLVLYLVEPRVAVWLADTLRTVPLPTSYRTALEGWARRETFMALLVATAALLLLGPGRRLPAKRLEIALLALLAADLAWNDRLLLPVVPRSVVEIPPAVLDGHPPDDGRLFTDFALSREARVPLRYDRPGPDQLWHGIETLEPYIATLWGYDYVLHHDYDLMLTAAGRQALVALEQDWRSPERAERFLGAWGVGTVARERPLAEVLRERFQGGEAPRVRIEANPYQLPEIRWAPRVEFHADPEAALSAARDDGYRFAERAHWVGSPPIVEDSWPGAPSRPPSFDELRPSWNHLEFRTRAQHPPYLQIARTFDGGWRASIDGERSALHLTASGQMGLVVPPGAHRVVLRYFDAAVPAGAGLTTLGLVAALWLWRRDRPSATRPEPPR